MNKSDVVNTLKEMADLLEVADANTFEVAAYRKASQAIDEWDGDLNDAVAQKSVGSIPSVGKGIASVVSELVANDSSKDLDRVRSLVPPKLPILLRVRGLGPKRVRTLWRELDIESPDDLRKAANDGRVQTLKGFGAKTIERIIAGLDYLETPAPARISADKVVEVPQAIASTGRIWAGVSGYSYAGWKGSFYPEGTKADEFLQKYSERLSTVEINNTFYRFPSESVIQQWRDQTPEGFQFAVKANRRITHLQRLGAGASQQIVDFVRRCCHLGHRLGSILFQLPPDLKYEDARLDTLLNAIPDGPRYAVEFRHSSWMDDVVFQKLTSSNVALVIGTTEASHIRTADFIYARLPADAADDEDSPWENWLKTQSAAGHDVLAYFKHDDEGDVPRHITERWGTGAV